MRWLEEVGPPFDLDAAVAAAAKDGDNRADWDVDQLQALQAQQVVPACTASPDTDAFTKAPATVRH